MAFLYSFFAFVLFANMYDTITSFTSHMQISLVLNLKSFRRARAPVYCAKSWHKPRTHHRVPSFAQNLSLCLAQASYTRTNRPFLPFRFPPPSRCLPPCPFSSFPSSSAPLIPSLLSLFLASFLPLPSSSSPLAPSPRFFPRFAFPLFLKINLRPERDHTILHQLDNL